MHSAAGRGGYHLSATLENEATTTLDTRPPGQIGWVISGGGSGIDPTTVADGVPRLQGPWDLEIGRAGMPLVVGPGRTRFLLTLVGAGPVGSAWRRGYG